MIKRWFILFICALFLVTGTPVTAQGATPIIRETDPSVSVYNCYFHYDGKIYVYTTSRYRKEVKRAIRLLNKRFDVFRYTKDKTKRDVLIKDKSSFTGQSMPKNQHVLALTTHYNATIILYKKMFKRMGSGARILTIAHELGHAAGLAHASSRKSLMYPYMNQLKAKGLSSADVRALRKARKYSKEENKNRRKPVLEFFLAAEKAGKAIGFHMPSQGKGMVILTFPKRGIRYSSSNRNVLETYQNGLLLIKKQGSVTLKVNNRGTIHRFKIHVR